MSVDRTIEELSGTLAQLGQLVGHINSQILGITTRINSTLDNFDRAVSGIAMDASSVTGQVGDSVSQVPNSWVFYLLFITLIVVFILLSIVLLLNLITKLHAIYNIIKGISNDGSERSLIAEDQSPDRNFEKTPISSINLPSYNHHQRGHVAISMESEPRRPGRRVTLARVGDSSWMVHGSLGHRCRPPRADILTQSILYAPSKSLLKRSEENISSDSLAAAGGLPGHANGLPEPLDFQSMDENGPYQRRFEDTGRYNLETGTKSAFPRSLQGHDV